MEEEKDGWGREEREWSLALGHAGASKPLRVGGPAQASASLQSPDSRKSGCFLPMFRVSPNVPSLGQLHHGQWQHWSCAQPLPPETEGGGLRVQTGGSRAWAHLVALHLVAACGTGVRGASRSLPWTEKGHSSA